MTPNSVHFGRETPKFRFEFCRSLTLRSLFFSFSMLSSFSDFPCFFVHFPFFSKDFRGSAKRKTLAFFGFPLLFFKKARVGGSGFILVWLYSSCFLQGKRPEKIHQKSAKIFTQDFVGKNSPKIPQKIHPGLCWETFSSDFCRNLLLKIVSGHFCLATLGCFSRPSGL